MLHWQPVASIENLRLRAHVLSLIRSFFDERSVLEIETPLLCATTASDPHITSLSCDLDRPGAEHSEPVYLQTSPELAMKRLLSSGSGPIFQICKAFRNGEAGRLHNPEFTILEWYRPGFDHHQLMDEVDELLSLILGLELGERLSYAEALNKHAGVDALGATTDTLQRAARAQIPSPPDLDNDDRDGWLDLMLSHLVEPQLGRGRPCFIFDYPRSQAALARINPGDNRVAERFEVWVEGIELANGYHELRDQDEQRRRIEADNAHRRKLGHSEVPIDERFLAALKHGLPNCAGVALGLDRLVMLAAGATTISEVITFPIDRA